MVGVFGELGVPGEFPGSVVLPGVPDSGGVIGLPGSGLISVAPDSGEVEFPGTVLLPGMLGLPGVLGSDGVMFPGAGGVKLLGAPG